MNKPIDKTKLTERHKKELKAKGKTKIGRNDLCLCGSGQKFKRCCVTNKGSTHIVEKNGRG